MKKINGGLLAALFTIAGLSAYADTLRLRTGANVEGTLVAADKDGVRFLGPDGSVKTYAMNTVRVIELGKDAPVETPPRPAAASRPANVSVPAGTEIVVRLIDPIDSTKTGPGERFRATIDDPVTVRNQVVIPRNADCTVQIIANNDSKDLSIKLYDVTINGKPYDAVSEYARVTVPGKGKKYAKRGIGLGAVGAGIGAIAGGGKGAAIGAVVGAGAGAVSVAAASGPKVQLPSETRLFLLLGPEW